MIAYLDASALAKRFLDEAGSDAVRGLLSRSIAVTSRLSVVEVSSALARQCREGSLDPAQRDYLSNQLTEITAKMQLVELIPEIVGSARELLVQHQLRASDAIQLASCLVLEKRARMPLVFAAYDRRLLEAARLCGLETFSQEA